MTGNRFVDRFTGRVAVVTGASRGIGLAIAQRVVAEGGAVVITARKPDGLAEALATLDPARARSVAGAADDAEHRAEAIDTAVREFGRLDLLVNNTGINPVVGPVLGTDPAAARKIMDVNLHAAVEWTRQARDAGLGADGAGAVVNMASVAGISPAPGIGYYGISKAALIGLTVQLAAELAPKIRVNAIAPAVVKTKFAAVLYENDEAAAAARYPLGRLGVPEDVAAATCFLGSADAGWITGQTLVLDGGAGLVGNV